MLNKDNIQNMTIYEVINYFSSNKLSYSEFKIIEDYFNIKQFWDIVKEKDLSVKLSQDLTISVAFDRIMKEDELIDNKIHDVDEESMYYKLIMQDKKAKAFWKL